MNATIKSVPEPAPPDPCKPLTERFGGRVLTADEYTATGKALTAPRLDTAKIEYAEMNLRHLLEQTPDVPPMSAEDLGRLVALADLAEANGQQLAALGESIRTTALALYWEKGARDA
jgi:hypothetical protein